MAHSWCIGLFLVCYFPAGSATSSTSCPAILVIDHEKNGQNKHFKLQHLYHSYRKGVRPRHPSVHSICLQLYKYVQKLEGRKLFQNFTPRGLDRSSKVPVFGWAVHGEWDKTKGGECYRTYYYRTRLLYVLIIILLAELSHASRIWTHALNEME